jgi:hypothetical protein
MPGSSSSPTRRLAFRASRLGECFSSECFLLPYDLAHARRAWTRVIVGYGWGQFVWWKYITRHWAVHWWIARVEQGGRMPFARMIVGHHNCV